MVLCKNKKNTTYQTISSTLRNNVNIDASILVFPEIELDAGVYISSYHVVGALKALQRNVLLDNDFVWLNHSMIEKQYSNYDTIRNAIYLAYQLRYHID